jgi:hypothetical protein
VSLGRQFRMQASELADVVDPNALTIGSIKDQSHRCPFLLTSSQPVSSADGEPREWTAT